MTDENFSGIDVYFQLLKSIKVDSSKRITDVTFRSFGKLPNLKTFAKNIDCNYRNDWNTEYYFNDAVVMLCCFTFILDLHYISNELYTLLMYVMFRLRTYYLTL